MPGADTYTNLQYPLVIFDGVCNLCCSSVEFILKRDRTKRLHFASRQWALAQSSMRLLHSLLKGSDTIVLIDNGNVYTQSSATLRICGHLRYPWPLCKVLLVIPKLIRDSIYNYISANRYKLFGYKTECLSSFPGWEGRFLSQD